MRSLLWGTVVVNTSTHRHLRSEAPHDVIGPWLNLFQRASIGESLGLRKSLLQSMLYLNQEFPDVREFV